VNNYVISSAIVALATAIGHSYIGETMLYGPLFAEAEHSGVMKSQTLRRVARAVWHLPSLCWLLMAIMSLVMAQQGVIAIVPLYFAIAVYVSSAAGNFIATRGRHFGWMLLSLAAALLWIGLPGS
jgi:hypothetical protein